MAKSRYRNERWGCGLAREYTDSLEVLYKESDKVREVYEEVVQEVLENGSTAVAHNTTIRLQAPISWLTCASSMTSELLLAKFVYLSTQRMRIGNSRQRIR